jgi:hypothetical protein
MQDSGPKRGLQFSGVVNLIDLTLIAGFVK